MGVAYLSELSSYPVKSLGGGSHDRAQVHPCGLAQDRRWMVVDQAHRFITQRDHPRMAVLHASVQDATLVLRAPSGTPLMLAPSAHARACRVRIWRDTVTASDCGEQAADWLSAQLGVVCRLVHLADASARKLRPDFAQNETECVSFADGFPVLLCSLASLADANSRLASPVPMARFRANFVIAGAASWDEDEWRRVRIGEVVFRVGKPCERCIVTTIDQDTGGQPDGNEPLATLGKFRRAASGKIMFGQNLVPESGGTLRAGDELEILQRGSPNFKKANG